LINLSELEELTNRNQLRIGVQPLNQQEIMRAQRTFLDITPKTVISPICFHLYRLGNGNDNISSEEHIEN
jgi:hypothetical protein